MPYHYITMPVYITSRRYLAADFIVLALRQYSIFNGVGDIFLLMITLKFVRHQVYNVLCEAVIPNSNNADFLQCRKVKVEINGQKITSFKVKYNSRRAEIMIDLIYVGLYLQYSDSILPCLLTKLFNLMFEFSYSPSSFGYNYIVPIPKPKDFAIGE